MNKICKTFYDENRKVYVTYEMLTESLSFNVVDDLMNGFAEVTGHYNSRSREQAWRSVKKFNLYLRLVGFPLADPGKDVVSGFAEYLQANESLKKTNGAHYNFIKRLVRSISESSKELAWMDQGLRSQSFTRERPCDRNNSISIKDLKAITEACKKEIFIIKQKFSMRGVALDERIKANKLYPQLDIAALRLLIDNENKGLWTQKHLRSGSEPRRATSGLRQMISYKELTLESALPLFLLIMIQTAANPIALMEIDLDCIRTSPIDPDSATLHWSKPRASKEQKLNLLRAGNYSVPSLVNLITDMTAPIRHLAKSADKDFLFLTRTGSCARRLSSQSLHNYLSCFRKTYGFSHFTFADIRRSVAELVYERTSSVSEVAKVLQHRNELTTQLYLRGDRVIQKKYERLNKFQGEMLKLTENQTIENYSTVLGFECRSPLAGTVGNSKRGEPCLEFLSCATCKNALIPVDDPYAIARVVRAREHLEKMEKSALLNHEDRERFDLVYRPVLNIITNEILGSVSRSTLTEADKLKSTMPELPVLL